MGVDQFTTRREPVETPSLTLEHEEEGEGKSDGCNPKPCPPPNQGLSSLIGWLELNASHHFLVDLAGAWNGSSSKPTAATIRFDLRLLRAVPHESDHVLTGSLAGARPGTNFGVEVW